MFEFKKICKRNIKFIYFQITSFLVFQRKQSKDFDYFLIG
jgi:hypothetical protein